MRNPQVLKGDYSLETMERKVEWFSRLTVEERFDLWQDWLDFILAVRPDLGRRDAPDSSRPVRVLRAPQC